MKFGLYSPWIAFKPRKAKPYARADFIEPIQEAIEVDILKRFSSEQPFNNRLRTVLQCTKISVAAFAGWKGQLIERKNRWSLPGDVVRPKRHLALRITRQFDQPPRYDVLLRFRLWSLPTENTGLGHPAFRIG